MRTARVTILAGSAVLCLATAACSSSTKSTGGGGSAPPATTGASTVHVKNFSFNPSTITVKTGAKVTWIFDDTANHNVTAGDKSFKSSDLSSGGTYSFTFNKAGTYSYICSIHQYMTAKVVVQ
ncbi:MAG TPA: cupredoxin family copper-binding protein [Jatrophihabitantaceae bacterium]|nr:cupredoxin family copper-binding protein [Jatrophihabitantaceae bacterium]